MRINNKLNYKYLLLERDAMKKNICEPITFCAFIKDDKQQDIFRKLDYLI